MSSRDAALAAFDEARDRFLVAFARVPDGALGFLKPGDDYALGGLPGHITWGLSHYGQVLAAAVSGGFGEVRDPVDGNEQERIGAAMRRGIDGDARPEALEAMRDAHDRLAEQFRGLSDGEFERTAPVFYGDAKEAFPTSAAAVAVWMTEHYDEHVPHVGDLLAAYEERSD